MQIVTWTQKTTLKDTKCTRKWMQSKTVKNGEIILYYTHTIQNRHLSKQWTINKTHTQWDSYKITTNYQTTPYQLPPWTATTSGHIANALNKQFCCKCANRIVSRHICKLHAKNKQLTSFQVQNIIKHSKVNNSTERDMISIRHLGFLGLAYLTNLFLMPTSYYASRWYYIHSK